MKGFIPRMTCDECPPCVCHVRVYVSLHNRCASAKTLSSLLLPLSLSFSPSLTKVILSRLSGLSHLLFSHFTLTQSFFLKSFFSISKLNSSFCSIILIVLNSIQFNLILFNCEQDSSYPNP